MPVTLLDALDKLSFVSGKLFKRYRLNNNNKKNKIKDIDS